MEKQILRVLIIENDAALVHSLQEALDGDEDLLFLGSLSSRIGLDEFLDQHAPDVAVVDIGLPSPGQGLLMRSSSDNLENYDEGMWVIDRINEVSPQTNVIAFSNHFLKEPELARRAYEVGANALIAKQNGPAGWEPWCLWICAQIHAVAGGYWHVTPEVARLLYQEEIKRQRTYDPLPLTKRQMQVLDLLAQGKLDREIASALVIEEGAVRNHISNIKRRLQLRYRWQVIEKANELGIGQQHS